CQITLEDVGESTTADVQLSSSSHLVRLPDRLQTRPGQSTVEFQVDAVGDAAADGIVVAAQLGSNVVEETISVAQDRSVPIRVPGRQFVKFGTEVRFEVSPANSSATLSSGPLPQGASFDAGAGVFH